MNANAIGVAIIVCGTLVLLALLLTQCGRSRTFAPHENERTVKGFPADAPRPGH